MEAGPFYLIHQTIIVVAGHHLDALHWPVALEAPTLIAATTIGCVAFYFLGRRIAWLRPWIGLGVAPALPPARRPVTDS